MADIAYNDAFQNFHVFERKANNMLPFRPGAFLEMCEVYWTIKNVLESSEKAAVSILHPSEDLSRDEMRESLRELANEIGDKFSALVDDYKELFEGFEKESSRHWLFPFLFRFVIRPKSIEIYNKLADAEALLEAARNEGGNPLSLSELSAAIDAPG